MQKQKFSRESDDVVKCACSNSIAPLVILDEGTVDHSYYIKNVFPVTLKYENEVFDVTTGSFNKIV